MQRGFACIWHLIFQVNTSNLTTKSDIWSYGLLVCEILEKTPQFRSQQWYRQMRDLSREQQISPFELIAQAFYKVENGNDITRRINDITRRINSLIVKLIKEEFPELHKLLKVGVYKEYFLRDSRIKSRSALGFFCILKMVVFSENFEEN